MLEIRIPFRTLNFNPNSDTLGDQLPAHGAAQERRQHLDGMGPQPGAAPHDQRRPRHRHPQRDAGARPRHQAVRPVHVGSLTRPRPAHARRQRQRRRRSLLQPHARSCGPTSPSTPTSRKQKSISDRSTSPASRSSFPRSATSSSTARPSSTSAARSTATCASTPSSAGGSA